jgi:large subunit ribosomal protein L6
MSRVGEQPVPLPSGVEAAVDGQKLSVKGPKGVLEMTVHGAVGVSREGEELRFTARKGADGADALSGTMRALANNMVTGVNSGFEKRLVLEGVGYRAQAQGKVLNLTLGFSHPVNFPIPDGVAVDTPSQTEIVVRGIDKQQVGAVAAQIRSFRPPEPYKGKGVRYAGEVIVRKEGKKK